jgi:hypothetical protein
MDRMLFGALFLGAVFATPLLAQENQFSTAPIEACASSPPPERNGVAVETGDPISLIARGLEAAATAKKLFLNPDPLRAAQWCLEEDAVASSKSRQHWRNIAPADSGALITRLANLKGTSTIYLIRVADGSSAVPTANGYRQVSNYAAIIDEPDELVIAGYFAGHPETKEILEHMWVRGRINKADGKTKITMPK